MRPSRLLVGLALVVLAGCTPIQPEAPVTPRPTALPAPTGSTDGTTVAEARAGLAQADTGAFTTVVQLAGGSVSRTGIYRLSTASTRYSVTLTLAGQNAVTSDVIALGRRTWVRIGVAGLPSTTGRTCWIRVGPASAVRAVGTDFAPVRTGYPPELVAVTLAEGGPGTARTATSDLATVASLVIGRVPGELGLGSVSAARVAVGFVLAGGGLTGYDVSLDDVLAAAQQVARPLPRAVPFLTGGRLQVRFTQVGEPVTIDAPPPDEVVPYTRDREAFDAAMTACTTGSGG